MELAQQISVEHTRKLFGGKIGLMFYDVTTLYFETAQTDVLREAGFSKDGKTAESQVVLGLLVSEGGYPLSYSLFNGSQYEGFTMIPMIDDFKQRFNLGKDFVVVADSGLMNKNNVTLLQEAGYNYILGARIKSESASVKQWILSLEKVDKACYDYKRENGERLIVSYSDKRAKKDAYNRDRGIARLKKAYKTGRITKSQVNKRGYNKFLEISKDIEVVISEEKIAEDCQWDGLKGYITNTDLDAERVRATEIINGDSVRLLRSYFNVVDDKYENTKKFGVVVAEFDQILNARSYRDRLKQNEGFQSYVVYTNREKKYCVVAQAYDEKEPAALFIRNIKQRMKMKVLVPRPYILQRL